MTNSIRQNREIEKFLHTVELFEGLHQTTIAKIRRHLQERKLSHNEILFLRDEPAENLYVVRYGEVKVWLGAEESKVRFISPGEVLGENSLLTSMTHSSTAIASLETLVYVIEGKFFLSLAENNHTLSEKIVRLMGKRMRDSYGTGEPKSLSKRMVFHILLGEIADFSLRLRQLAEESGKICSCAGQAIDVTGLQSASAEEIGRFIGLQRKKFSILHLYYTAREIPAALEKLVQESDYTVFWDDSSEHSVDEQKSRHAIVSYWQNKIRIPGKRILFSITDGDQPRLEPLAQNAPRVFFSGRRLNRHLFSRSRGLTLGGGGARAIAHVGLLRVLEHQKIDIDFISGSSMGALVAALYARGDSAREIEQLFCSFFTGLKNIFDPAIPLVAFYHGKKIEAKLKEVFGDTLIEDLPIPFATSAVDLQSGKEVVLDRGPIWEALRCTVSLPGVFPPYILRGNVMADGSILNNIPVDLIRIKGADIILGVNVSPLKDYQIFNLLQPASNKYAHLFENLRHPPLIKIMMRSASLQGQEITRLKQHNMDLFLSLDIKDFGMFEFARCQEIVWRGELEAKRHLAEIRQIFGLD